MTVSSYVGATTATTAATTTATMTRGRGDDDDDVRSKIFQKIGRVGAIDLVRKSSKSEPSSQFFGRLKILTKFRSTDRKFGSTDPE